VGKEMDISVKMVRRAQINPHLGSREKENTGEGLAGCQV
jgi:hypothetical protein